MKKNRHKLITLRHIMTRPMIIPQILGWYEGVGEYLLKQYGIGMREHILFYRGGVVKSYRSQRQFQRVKRFLINHPALIIKILKQAKPIYQQFIRFQKKLNKSTLQNNPRILNDFYAAYLASWSPNFFAFWTPQLVNKKELGKFGNLIFRLSDQARTLLDPLVFAGEFYHRAVSLINKDEKLLKYCTKDEFYRYLAKQLNKNEHREILKREAGWLIYEDKSWFAEDLDKANKILRRLGFQLEKEPPVKEIEKLTGSIAFRGRVQGRVKLLFNYDDNRKVKKGDIIVSPMTTPAFMPAITRCSGMVTDEGGITCHAAIVSRELKIPRVVGTKIATKVFKDGDRVEVDANKGVIRKL